MFFLGFVSLARQYYSKDHQVFLSLMCNKITLLLISSPCFSIFLIILTIFQLKGTGKTSLVRAIASVSHRRLLCISPASMFSKWTGESEKSLREAFHTAKEFQPSILFFDELDALASSRNGAISTDISARRFIISLEN